jgi:nicotinamide mononucleotide transporter
MIGVRSRSTVFDSTWSVEAHAKRSRRPRDCRLSPLEIAAFLFTGISVWLSVKQHIASWPTAIVGVGLYIVVCLQAKLYADMGLQVVYVLLSIYGWYEWLHGGANKGRLQASFASRRVLLVSGAIGAVSAVLLGFTLARTTDAALPWVDSTLTSFSLVAQWQMTRKYTQNWLLWIAVDVFYVPMWAYKHLYLTSALYVIFLGMAAQGYREWRRDVASR